MLLVFLWTGILAPVAFPLQREQAPACCRRDGKHHCAMRMQSYRMEDQSSAFRAKSEPCPYRAANVARCGVTLSLPGRLSFLAASDANRLLLAARLDRVPNLHLITRSERGPPAHRG